MFSAWIDTEIGDPPTFDPELKLSFSTIGMVPTNSRILLAMSTDEIERVSLGDKLMMILEEELPGPICLTVPMI